MTLSRIKSRGGPRKEKEQPIAPLRKRFNNKVSEIEKILSQYSSSERIVYGRVLDPVKLERNEVQRC